MKYITKINYVLAVFVILASVHALINNEYVPFVYISALYFGLSTLEQITAKEKDWKKILMYVSPFVICLLVVLKVI